MNLLFLLLIAVASNGCVSLSYHQRAVKEAHEEEQARCERWLNKVASKELSPREVLKLRGGEKVK